MRLTKKDAALLSDRERELLQAKGPWQVKDLVKTIERVRALRDKASDLLQRQTIAVRKGKGAQRPGAVNERSAAKLELLERALTQFRHDLDSIDAESTQAVAAMRLADKGARPKRGAPAQNASDKARGEKGSAARKSSAAGKAASSRAVAKKPSKRLVEDMRSPAQRKTAVAKKRPAGPRTERSSKARQPIARSIDGPGSPQQFSSASRKSRAAKSRRV
jgi:hypothetical protein